MIDFSYPLINFEYCSHIKQSISLINFEYRPPFSDYRYIQDGEAKEKVRNFEISTKIETIDFSYQFHAHRGGRD